MSKIEKLDHKVIHLTPKGLVVVGNDPTITEIVMKLNTVIDVVNELSERKQDKPLRSLGTEKRGGKQ